MAWASQGVMVIVQLRAFRGRRIDGGTCTTNFRLGDSIARSSGSRIGIHLSIFSSATRLRQSWLSSLVHQSATVGFRYISRQWSLLERFLSQYDWHLQLLCSCKHGGVWTQQLPNLQTSLCNLIWSASRLQNVATVCFNAIYLHCPISTRAGRFDTLWCIDAMWSRPGSEPLYLLLAVAVLLSWWREMYFDHCVHYLCLRRLFALMSFTAC